MTMIEEYIKATESLESVKFQDGKERAHAEYSACARWVDAGLASAQFRAWFNHAPDEPRAWRDYPLPEEGGEV